MAHPLNTPPPSLQQARRKQFKVGPAKIWWSAKGVITLEGPWACSRGKVWNLAFLISTFGAFSERINEKINQNLRWKLHVFSS